jgi:hypothetical protein
VVVGCSQAETLASFEPATATTLSTAAFEWRERVWWCGWFEMISTLLGPERTTAM